MVINKTLLCIVDYYSRFLTVKKTGSLSEDDLVQRAKLIFAEYGLPKELFQIQKQISCQKHSKGSAER